MNIFIVMFGHLLLSLALVDVGILALPAEEEEDGALDEDFEEDVGHVTLDQNSHMLFVIGLRSCSGN